MLANKMNATIVICNPKGGSGKTTLSTNLAVALSRLNYSVTLHDLDPQLSCSDWIRCRNPLSNKIQLSLDFDTRALGWHIFDTPAGFLPEQLAKVSLQANYLLIPVLPSSFDIHACVRFLMSLNKADLFNRNWKIAMVANRVKTGTLSQRTLDAFLEHLQIPFISELSDSQNYVRASERGMGLLDLPPYRINKEAKKWQQILNWLDIDSSSLQSNVSPLQNLQNISSSHA